MAEGKLACELCGSAKSLICHHESYEPERVLTLCEPCHAMLHKHDKTLPKRPQGFVSKVVKYRRVLTVLSEEDCVFLENKSRETGISISGLVRLAVKEWIKKEGQECR